MVVTNNQSRNDDCPYNPTTLNSIFRQTKRTQVKLYKPEALNPCYDFLDVKGLSEKQNKKFFV